MKKKKLLFIFCITTFVLCILLLYSNTLIMNLCVPNEFRTKKVNFNDFNFKDDVYYFFDYYAYTGGMCEYFYIDGWTFCETEAPNDNHFMKIILKPDNSNEAYAVTAQLNISRPDIGLAFPNQKIQGYFHGFRQSFATFNIRNGYYHIYLYVWENETNYGMIDTGRIFIKENGTARIEYP